MSRSYLCGRLLMAAALAAITISAACVSSVPKNALPAQVPTGAATEPLSEKIELAGKVIAISQIDAKPPSFRNWAVTIRVEKVKAGRYSQPEFTFTVHSPALAGLFVGHRCAIKATWTGQGYLVDDTGWMGNENGRSRKRFTQQRSCDC